MDLRSNNEHQELPSANKQIMPHTSIYNHFAWQAILLNGLIKKGVSCRFIMFRG